MEKKATTSREYIVQEIERFDEIIDNSERNNKISNILAIPVCLGLIHGALYYASLSPEYSFVAVLSMMPLGCLIATISMVIGRSIKRTQALLRKDEFETKLKLDDFFRSGDPENKRAREYIEKNIDSLKSIDEKKFIRCSVFMILTVMGVALKTSNPFATLNNEEVITFVDWISSMLIAYGVTYSAVAISEHQCYESRIDNLESKLDLDEIKRTRKMKSSNSGYTKEGNPNE